MVTFDIWPRHTLILFLFPYFSNNSPLCFQNYFITVYLHTIPFVDFKCKVGSDDVFLFIAFSTVLDKEIDLKDFYGFLILHQSSFSHFFFFSPLFSLPLPLSLADTRERGEAVPGLSHLDWLWQRGRKHWLWSHRCLQSRYKSIMCVLYKSIMCVLFFCCCVSIPLSSKLDLPMILWMCKARE